MFERIHTHQQRGRGQIAKAVRSLNTHRRRQYLCGRLTLFAPYCLPTKASGPLGPLLHLFLHRTQDGRELAGLITLLLEWLTFRL